MIKLNIEKTDHSGPLFYIFVFSTVNMFIMKLRPWLDLNLGPPDWKRPLSQLSHNHCPNRSLSISSLAILNNIPPMQWLKVFQHPFSGSMTSMASSFVLLTSSSFSFVVRDLAEVTLEALVWFSNENFKQQLLSLFVTKNCKFLQKLVWKYFYPL